ncbi:MAG: LacI family DNA-binding transcriptional regulator [Oceanospirillaceae bacterium]|nr:LacI family DNA-binding transcriptional regulator [Oceanospirillaceae bacterium]
MDEFEKTLERPRAQDVARLAGVSTATVSRFFSDPGRVREETAARISEAIEKLSYVPDLNARALASRRADVIGAVVPTLENAIFAEGIEAMQAWLNERNITLLVASSNYSPDREYEQVQRLIAHGVCALLLIGTERHQRTRKLIEARKVPYCLSWCSRPTCDEPQIGFDNYSAGASMAQEILDRGHEKIGILSGIRAWNDRATDRVQGAIDRFSSAGCPVATDALVEAPYNHEVAADALTLLLARHPDLSCVFCANDVLAAGAIRQAHLLGKRVPEDLSITGFDDIAMAQVMTPALTTVRLRHKYMGALAGERLFDAVENGGVVKSEKIAYSIVFRDSLGPCPSRPI